jgi:hypothetical protein
LAETITPLRLNLLQLVAKHPDIRREHLLALKGVTAADLAYLEGLDLIREREPGCYRIAHLGQLALKRGSR